MQKITLSNNKGGSGKTTTTVNLASAFAERGFRVLVVDLDPQGSATAWLGGCESSTGLVEFSAGGLRVSELVVTSTAPGVDLVPTSLSLVPSGESSTNETGLAIVRAFARSRRIWSCWTSSLFTSRSDFETSPSLNRFSVRLSCSACVAASF